MYCILTSAYQTWRSDNKDPSNLPFTGLKGLKPLYEFSSVKRTGEQIDDDTNQASRNVLFLAGNSSVYGKCGLILRNRC